MWIAADALAHDLPPATLDLKDYEDFRFHHGLRVPGAGQHPTAGTASAEWTGPRGLGRPW